MDKNYENKVEGRSQLDEINYGYQDADEGVIVYPGADDSISINFASDGIFFNHSQSVTFVVKTNDYQAPIFIWIVILLLISSIFLSAIIGCRLCRNLRNHKILKKQKNNNIYSGVSHINGFSQDTIFLSTEMFQHKLTTQSHLTHSTRKLHQWCQEREIQQYKSLWTFNSDNATSTSNDRMDSVNYKTRSLPSKNKPRPCSSIEDLDDYYSKVNFSKKMRNRMTNDEAAIIAFCRTKSQNISSAGNCLRAIKGDDDDAVVIYDERTAL